MGSFCISVPSNPVPPLIAAAVKKTLRILCIVSPEVRTKSAGVATSRYSLHGTYHRLSSESGSKG